MLDLPMAFGVAHLAGG